MGKNSFVWIKRKKKTCSQCSVLTLRPPPRLRQQRSKLCIAPNYPSRDEGEEKSTVSICRQLIKLAMKHNLNRYTQKTAKKRGRRAPLSCAA
ncbi:MAG: hypothetical protein IJR28_04990 [Ottowia sp.]|nr:hypothetical protein [Ottowia sp.]